MSLVTQLKCKDCQTIFSSTSADSNQICTNCGGRNTQPVKKPGGLNWKIIAGLACIFILILSYFIGQKISCEYDAICTFDKCIDADGDKKCDFKPEENIKFTIQVPKIVKDNHVKIKFQNSKGETIAWKKSWDKKIQFTVENLDKESKQIIEINEGIIAPCFTKNDTVNLKLKWKIIKKHESIFSSATVLKKSQKIKFVKKENQNNHKNADCFFKPTIKDVKQNNDYSITVIFSDEIEEEFEKNKKILVSITGENGDFQHKKTWKWNAKYEQEKMNIWAYLEGKKEQTLTKYKRNGMSYNTPPKPLDQKQITEIKSGMKKVIRNFLNNPSNIDDIMDFCSKHVSRKAKIGISNTNCKLKGQFLVMSFIDNIIMSEQTDLNCLKNSKISVTMEKDKITNMKIY